MTLRYRWIILGVGAGGAGAFATLQMGLASLGPYIRNAYDLSLPEVGVAFAAVAGGTVLTLIPWGVLADRVGERAVMAAGLAGTSIALAGTAYASGFVVLLTGLFAAGMLGASTTGASGRAVMGWFDRSERGFALGIRQMGLPVGGAVGSFALPHIADIGGLRGAFLVLSGLTLTAAVASLCLMRDAPVPAKMLPAALAPPPMCDRRLWRLGAGGALLVAAQASLVNFVVLYLHDTRGLSPATAAACLGGVQLLGGGARIVAGRRSDRKGLRIAPIRRIAVHNAVLLALTAALTAAPGALLYPVLVCTVVSALTWNGLAFTAAAEISGRARAGTAMSFENTIIAMGGGLGPLAFGAVVDATSWPGAFAMFAVAPLAALWVLRPLESDEDDRLAERERLLAGAERRPREA